MQDIMFGFNIGQVIMITIEEVFVDRNWETILHFYSVEAVKAGWLQKNKGVWYITPEGKEAIKL